MIGIKGFGVYIPRPRLSRDKIAEAWGGNSAGGEIAIANYDEDSATMAIEAVLNCLSSSEPGLIDTLFFASTTAPYLEKQTASLIAAVADLPRNVRTNDFGNSLRSGTQALLSAYDAVRSGSAKNAIVAGGECRLAEPDSEEEQYYGDAGAALWIGPEPIATIDAVLNVSDEMMGLWRTQEEKFTKKFSSAFATKVGFQRVVQEAILGILERNEFKPADFKKVAIRTPEPKAVTGIFKKCGFDLKTQAVDSLWRQIGDTGSVQPLLQIASFLEGAKPRDKLLLVSYGDGADALVITATEKVSEAKPDLSCVALAKQERGLSYYLNKKRLVVSYGNYLRFRKLVISEEQDEDESSAIVLWREGKQNLAFYGVKCKNCGAVQFPMQRVCYACGTKDKFEEFKMKRQGKVFTFTNDYLADVPEPPVTQTIVDFEDGSRFYCRMTDNDPKEVRVDMPVEMTFRILHKGGGFNNYFWKCKPL